MNAQWSCSICNAKPSPVVDAADDGPSQCHLSHLSLSLSVPVN